MLVHTEVISETQDEAQDSSLESLDGAGALEDVSSEEVGLCILLYITEALVDAFYWSSVLVWSTEA